MLPHKDVLTHEAPLLPAPPRDGVAARVKELASRTCQRTCHMQKARVHLFTHESKDLQVRIAYVSSTYFLDDPIERRATEVEVPVESQRRVHDGKKCVVAVFRLHHKSNNMNDSHRARARKTRADAEKARRARDEQLFVNLKELVLVPRARGIGAQWRKEAGAVYTMLATTRVKYNSHVCTLAAAREFIEDGDKRIAALEQRLATAREALLAGQPHKNMSTAVQPPQAATGGGVGDDDLWS